MAAMRKNRKFGAKAWACTGSVLGAALLTWAGPVAFSQDTSPFDTKPRGQNPVFGTGTDPAGFANILLSCKPTPLQESFSALNALKPQASASGKPSTDPAVALAQLMGQGVSAGSVCGPEIAIPDDSRRTCETFNAASISQQKKALELALLQLKCKQSKLQAIQGEMDCLSRQANSLAQTIQQLQNGGPGGQPPGVAGEMARMAGEAAQMKGYIDEMSALDQEVLKRLKGDDVSEVEGATNLLKNPDDLVKKMGEERLKAEQGVEVAKQSRITLNQTFDAALASDARECLKNRREPTFLCAVNGSPVTLQEHMKCIIEQQTLRDEKGNRKQDQLSQRQGSSKGSALDAVLNQLFSDMPENVGIPEDLTKLTPPPGKTRIRKAEDIEKLYSSKLSAFKTQKGTAADFVSFYAKKCFSEATQRQAPAKARANAQFEMQMEQMRATMREQIRGYAESYTRALKALTGQNFPLDTSGCERQKIELDAQLACHRDIQENVRGMIRGSSPNSKMTLRIQGAKSAFLMDCNGISGCVAALQQKHTQIDQEKRAATVSRQNYIQTSNRNIQNYFRQIAGQLSPQSQALMAHLKALNLALGSLGVSRSIKIDAVKAEDPEFEEEAGAEGRGSEKGLMKPPKNILNFVGGMMSPPLLDVSADVFEGGASAIADGVEKLNEKLAKVAGSVQLLDDLAIRCPKEKAEKLVEGLNSLAATLAPGDCFGTDVCTDNSALSSLLKDLSDLPDVDLPVPPNLNKGTLCNEDKAKAACDKLSAQASEGMDSSKKKCLDDVAAKKNYFGNQDECRRVLTSTESRVKTILKIFSKPAEAGAQQPTN